MSYEVYEEVECTGDGCHVRTTDPEGHMWNPDIYRGYYQVGWLCPACWEHLDRKTELARRKRTEVSKPIDCKTCSWTTIDPLQDKWTAEMVPAELDGQNLCNGTLIGWFCPKCAPLAPMQVVHPDAQCSQAGNKENRRFSGCLLTGFLLVIVGTSIVLVKLAEVVWSSDIWPPALTLTMCLTVLAFAVGYNSSPRSAGS